ncbi:hypothetical protein EMIT0324P_21000 [Pseudomonas chlororaphis]
MSSCRAHSPWRSMGLLSSARRSRYSVGNPLGHPYGHRAESSEWEPQKSDFRPHAW